MTLVFVFFNDTATTEIYTLSLHDALPISCCGEYPSAGGRGRTSPPATDGRCAVTGSRVVQESPFEFFKSQVERSEEHTSELQSRQYLVCRLLLEKKKYNL